MLVVQEFGVIEVRAVEMGGGSPRDRQELLDARPPASPFEPGEPLPQGLGDGAGHGLAGGACDPLGEPVGLWILDVKAHRPSPISQSRNLSTFLHHLAWLVYHSGHRPESGRGSRTTATQAAMDLPRRGILWARGGLPRN